MRVKKAGRPKKKASEKSVRRTISLSREANKRLMKIGKDNVSAFIEHLIMRTLPDTED